MKPLCAFAVLMAGGPAASADFVDTFESYTGMPALLAPGAWGDFGAFPDPFVALQTSGGNPGQYVFHPGGQTMRHQLSPVSTVRPHPNRRRIAHLAGTQVRSPTYTARAHDLAAGAGGRNQ
jgi:hypothetical protein